MRIKTLLLGALLSVFHLGSHAQPAPLDQGLLDQSRKQLQAGQGVAAYNALLPHVAGWGGRPEFDLLLGQAALVADEPSIALMAFERCLLVDPALDTCRLGLARSHLALNEFEDARLALQSITDTALADQVRETADLYRSRLAAREQSGHTDTRFTAWIQAGLGYDSNANAATSRNTLDEPPVVIELSRNSKKRESFFHKTQLGLSYSTPMSENWRFLLDSSVQTRNYWSLHDYDSIQADLSLGARYSKDRNRVTMRALGQHYNLNGRGYRNLYGVAGEYSYALTEQAELGGYVQHTHMQYPGRSWLNANRTTLGLMGSVQLAQGQALAYASLYGGRHDAYHRHAPKSISYDFYGGRLGGLWLITPRARLDAGIAVEQRRYDGKDAIFIAPRNSAAYANNDLSPLARRDTQYSTWLGLNYAINRRVSIRPRYQYTHNKSSFSLREHQRHVFTVDLRYEIF